MTVHNIDSIKAITKGSVVTISVKDILGKPIKNARVYIGDVSLEINTEILNVLTDKIGQVTFECPNENRLHLICRVRKPQYKSAEFKLDDDTSECDITITLKVDSLY